MKKMQHCDYCGEEIGVFAKYPGDILSCGQIECNRAARDDEQARRDEAHEQLDRDMGY